MKKPTHLRLAFSSCSSFYARVSMGGRQNALFMHCLRTIHKTHNHFIQEKNIKNESHDTIYTFKNYFAIVFSVFNNISCIQTNPKCAFGSSLKNQLILLFSIFLLLFINPTALFDTIHRLHCIISANFYFYLQYFQQKVFSFSKINKSQTDPKDAK